MTDDTHLPSADSPGTTDATEPRLLPWTGEGGKPVYVVGEGGIVSRVADVVEALHLAAAEDLLGLALTVLDTPTADAEELRFMGRELAGALRATLRVAHSRGGRAS